MNTLFDLDALPTKDDTPATPAQQIAKQGEGRWYIWKLIDGERYFLWRSHDNGGETWVRESNCGRKRPMWYKHAHTARIAMTVRGADGYGLWGGVL